MKFPFTLLLLIFLLPFSDSSTCNVLPFSCPANRPENSLPTTPLTPCSSQGTCQYGACNCNAGWGGLDCSRTVKKMKLGAMIVTQAALDDAPTRYLDLVTDAFNSFRDSTVEIPPVNQKSCLEYILKTPLIPKWDISFELDLSSIRIQIINLGIHVGAKFRVNIPRIPLDVYVSKFPGSGSCCTPVTNTSLFAETATCAEACSSANGDQISLAFDMEVGGNVFPYLNESTGNVQAVVPPGQLTVAFTPPELGFALSCDLSPYPALVLQLTTNYVTNWGLVLNQAFTQAFQTTVIEYAETMSYSSGRVVNMTNSTSVQLATTSFTFVENSHVLLVLEGTLKTKRFGGAPQCPVLYSYFVPREEEEEFNSDVPLDFDGFFESAPGHVLQTLLAGRLSRVAVQAAYWSSLLDQTELVKELTSYSRKQVALDATYIFDWSWELPVITFPVTRAGNGSVRTSNAIRFTIPRGEFGMRCNNSQQTQVATQFAESTFDVIPYSVGNFTDVYNPDPQFLFTGRIFDWDVSHFNMNITIPQHLGVSNALVRVGFKEFLKTRLAVANDLLKEMAIELPYQVRRFVPGPRLQAIHNWDDPGRDNGNGFLEITTRCACNTALPYVSVMTQQFGKEIIPRCVQNCNIRRRRQLFEYSPPSHIDLGVPSPKRDLAATAVVLCGSNTDAKVQALQATMTQLLTCATKKDYASFSQSAVSLACMEQLEPNMTLGLCNPLALSYLKYGKCSNTMAELFPPLFNRQCVVGPYFSCQDSVEQVWERVCSCKSHSNIRCNNEIIPWIVIAAGIGLPLIFWSFMLFVAMRTPKARLALLFRVRMRDRDRFIVTLASFSSLVFLGGCYGWTVSDPLRNFAKEIVESDLFNTSDFVQSEFSTFMVFWSMVVLFFMSLGASQLVLFSAASFYLGRCLWLHPVARYRKLDQWFMPNQYLMSTWKSVALMCMSAIRVQVFLLICTLACPPMFYPFRFSIYVQEPQFGVVPMSLKENLTSIATNEEGLNLLKTMLGFSLMSSAMGFVSSGLVYVFHGAVPGAFAAAQLMIYFIERKMQSDRELYEQYKNVMPPPDNGELDRWRRIIYLFAWCMHFSGALGSAIGAIILYQALRAPSGWALIWVNCWVMTIPFLYVGTNRRFQRIPYVNAFVTVAYTVLFWALTLSMLFLTPKGAGFSVWFGALLLLAIYLFAFVILLSEFVNIAQRIVGETKTLDPREEFKKIKKQAAIASTPPMLDLSNSTTSGNPLYEKERKNLAPSAPPPPLVTVEPNEHDLMRLMASPTNQKKQQEVQGMAQAANRLQNKARMSLARPVKMSDTTGRPAAPVVVEMNPTTSKPAPVIPDRSLQPKGAFASFASSTPSNFLDTSVALSRAQQREKERMTKRISSRLAARGVTGDAAKELTERIALFHTMKMQDPYHASGNNASSSSALPRTPKPPQQQQQQPKDVNRSPTKQPQPSTSSVKSSPNMNMKQTFEAATPLAAIQASETSKNSRMDDIYARQFDSRNAKVDWDGDDSFLSFIQEVMSQLVLNARNLVQRVKQALTCSRKNQVANESLSGITVAKLHDIPSKPRRCNTLRNLMLPVTNVVFETKEKMDPATYGLRIPGRRFMFLQGLVMMFILLVYTSQNRVTVVKLKDQVVRLLVVGVDQELDLPAGTYAWPGLENVTEVLDAPFGAYVLQADTSYQLYWVIWALWVFSFIVEVSYSNFGRDQEEKRQGIRYSRWLSLANLPLLMLAVLLPCGPDYVGFAIPGFYKLIPMCAPRFNDFLVTLANNVFGVLAGSYLTLQILFVILLIVPSLSRALFFIVVREILELQSLTVFEPRKMTTIARKRLQNTRFVWKISPIMSPVITYLPLLLLMQLLGQAYASALLFIFMGSPSVLALFALKQSPDDQRVNDWAVYSTIWVGFYVAPLSLIVLIESLNRGQVSFVVQHTFGNWVWYVKLMSEITIAIVVTSDLLYIFMASDDELEADHVINDYLDALQNEAAHLATEEGHPMKLDRDLDV